MNSKLALVSIVSLVAGPATAQFTARASVASSGVPADSISQWPAISADGSHIAFETFASNLEAGGATFSQIYVHDRQSGTTTAASLSTPGWNVANGACVQAALSADGSLVAFASLANNLVAGDLNNTGDVFLRDVAGGTTSLVSRSSTGIQANGPSNRPSFSADGRFVGFLSSASNLAAGDGPNSIDVFLRDRIAGTTECVSVSPAGIPAGGYSVSVSADGRFVAMDGAPALLPGGSPSVVDIYVRDRTLGLTERISVSSAGALADGDSGALVFGSPSISGDGRYVAFGSRATNLVPGDTNGKQDIFVRDRQAGTTVRASVSSLGVQGDEDSRWCSMSDNLGIVAFHSKATTLVLGVTGGLGDSYRFEPATATTSLVSTSTSSAVGDASSYYPSISADASSIAFFSSASNLVAGDANGTMEIFVRDLQVNAPAITSYCVAKQTSDLCIPVITTSGTPSLSGYDAFSIAAFHANKNSSACIFVWGAAPAALPLSGGTLCVQPPIVRATGQAVPGFGLPCQGSLSYRFSRAYAAAKSLSAGAVIYGQFWSRDNGFAPPNNVGLTDAIHFTLFALMRELGGTTLAATSLDWPK